MIERGKPPLWRPLYDLAWAKVLLWVASAGARGELRPGVHAYLAQLYFALADAFQARGRVATAKRMRVRGRMHELAGPPPEPPPLAMAMGIPRLPIITEALGEPTPSPPCKKREEESSVAGAGASYLDAGFESVMERNRPNFGWRPSI